MIRCCRNSIVRSSYADASCITSSFVVPQHARSAPTFQIFTVTGPHWLPVQMASSSTDRDAATPKLHVPQGNDNVLEKAAAPLATISSHADPWPHYIMSGACGLSALYSYSSLNNPRMAAIKAALGATYLFAGRQLVTGNPRLGYDLGTVSSLALVGVAGPRARATQEMSSVAMAALGGISSVTNLIKSYEIRTGKPKEMAYERS